MQLLYVRTAGAPRCASRGVKARTLPVRLALRAASGLCRSQRELG
jgi:hypothetical protein